MNFSRIISVLFTTTGLFIASANSQAEDISCPPVAAMKSISWGAPFHGGSVNYCVNGKVTNNRVWSAGICGIVAQTDAQATVIAKQLQANITSIIPVPKNTYVSHKDNKSWACEYRIDSQSDIIAFALTGYKKDDKVAAKSCMGMKNVNRINQRMDKNITG